MLISFQDSTRNATFVAQLRYQLTVVYTLLRNSFIDGMLKMRLVVLTVCERYLKDKIINHTGILADVFF